MRTLKVLVLPLALLWCLSPSVIANLGQEIAQIGEEEVASSIEDAAEVSPDIELPEFDEVPDVGAAVLPPPPEVPDDVAPAAATVIFADTPAAGPLPAVPAPEATFADTRLGAAFTGDTSERVAQFIIAFWHQLILDLQLADYSRVDDTGTEVTAPENPGPCYASRAMAIAHLAMYDAYVGVTCEGDTYLEYSRRELPTGVDEEILPVAAAAAAGTTAALVLSALYQNPDDQIAIEESRQSFEDNLFEQFGGIIPFVNGTDEWPVIVADKILADRRNDGAGDPADLAFIPFEQVNGGSNDTYEHVPDPTAVDPESGTEQFLYAPHWGTVKPFLHSGKRLPSLPTTFGIRTLEDGPLANYLEEYKEIFDLGRNESDIMRPPLRTQEQTRIGIFWAYDGGFKIGVPPRLYNSITDDIVIDLVGRGDRNIRTGYQLIRLYAMVNVALADSGISAWRDKYRFNFWRPIIGIRRADEDPDTDGLQDETWAQLGAPNTNRDRPGINPAFPAYPSGHATFGTSVLEVVKLALHQPDQRKFEMYSDEFNGESIDDGYCSKFDDCVDNARPFLTRTLTIDEAIDENKEGRLYLGVHWRADQDAGVMLGERIAQNVIANFPRRFT